MNASSSIFALFVGVCCCCGVASVLVGSVDFVSEFGLKSSRTSAFVSFPPIKWTGRGREYRPVRRNQTHPRLRVVFVSGFLKLKTQGPGVLWRGAAAAVPGRYLPMAGFLHACRCCPLGWVVCSPWFVGVRQETRLGWDSAESRLGRSRQKTLGAALLLSPASADLAGEMVSQVIRSAPQITLGSNSK